MEYGGMGMFLRPSYFTGYVFLGLSCLVLAVTGCNRDTGESPVSALEPGITDSFVGSGTSTGSGVVFISQLMTVGTTQTVQVTQGSTCGYGGAACTTIVRPMRCRPFTGVTGRTRSVYGSYNACPQETEVMTLSNFQLCQGQTIYPADQSCGQQGEALGSLSFEVPFDPNSGALLGQLRVVWNEFIRRGPADPEISHYRIFAFGIQDMNSVPTTWVSPRVGGTLGANSTTLALGSIGDATTHAMITEIEATSLLNLSTEGFAMWNRLASYNSTGVSLGSLVNLDESGAQFWYEIVAFDVNDQPVLNRPANDAPREIIHRTFDVRQVPCGPTRVAGFCGM